MPKFQQHCILGISLKFEKKNCLQKWLNNKEFGLLQVNK